MRFLFNFLETREFNNSIKDPLISNWGLFFSKDISESLSSILM